jgi:hypothetical protein
MACPSLNPNGAYTQDFLLQTWTGPNGQQGVMDDTLPVDPATGIILKDAIQTKIQSLVQSGLISMSQQNPSGVMNNLKSEYCFYEQRYAYSLKQFLNAATLQQTQGSAAAAQANNWLELTQQLNKRTNSVLQILTMLPEVQMNELSTNQNNMTKVSNDLNAKLHAVQASYARLNSNDAVLESQKEMVRYTEEKNHYNHNRLILWTAMNILALGAIFYVYRA